VIARFVDIGEIVDHHCLNFLVIIICPNWTINNNKAIAFYVNGG